MAEKRFLGAFEILGTNKKDASELTDEEFDALADSLYDQISEKIGVQTITIDEEEQDNGTI